tara:strand:- start:1668 stop:1856 length:189 start_codon:yes stop_codon:yes gene_type:complete
MKANVLQLPVVIPSQIICTRQMWVNMDREEKVKAECKRRKENPPKLTALQKKLNNLITLQDE